MPRDERPKPPDIELVCDNASCGKTFTFSGGEQLFYDDRGFDPPALCKECRAEKKSQQNVTINCEACEHKRIIRKEYIIRYRRKDGPWVDPKLCKLCEENPNRVKQLLARKASSQKARDFLQGIQPHKYEEMYSEKRGHQGQRILKEAKLIVTRLFLHAGIKGGMSIILLQELQKTLAEKGMTSLESIPTSEYDKIMVRARKEERSLGFTQLTLRQHIWGDDKIPELIGHRKEFNEIGINTFEDAVKTIDNILASTDSTQVIEIQHKGRIKRFDLNTGIFIPASQNSSGVIRPHTAYRPDRGLIYFMEDLKIV